MTTKEKILKAALSLFNEEGMVNVRLQHIADQAGKSVGNLAYHFPNKDAIALALYRRLEQEQKDLQKEFRIVPLFDNLDRLLEVVFHHQQAYRFFYFDTLEITRAYPDIAREYQKHSAFEIQQWEQILSFNTSRGVFIPELHPGYFRGLARQLWATSSFWKGQETIRLNDTPQLSDYKEAIWNLLLPLFTNLGHQEYQQMLQSPYDFYLP